MKDPARWISDSRCPPDRRELLRHGIAMDPPPGAETQVWAALVSEIGPGAAADAGSATQPAMAAPGTAPAGIAIKTVIVSAATAVVVASAGGLALFKAGRRHAPPPASSAVVAPARPPTVEPLPTNPSSVEPTSAEPAAVEADLGPPAQPPRASASTSHGFQPLGRRMAVASQSPPVTPIASPAPTPSAGPPLDSAPADPTSTSNASLLREESALIRRAREALRTGNPRAALRLLEESRRRFPKATLEQERSRLTIAALRTQGLREEAKQIAAAFLHAYPNSPHAAEVRAYVDR